MPGLRSHVNPLAGDALVVCAKNGRMLSEPVIRVRDCSKKAVPPSGGGARGPRPGSGCAHGIAELLDAA